MYAGPYPAVFFTIGAKQSFEVCTRLRIMGSGSIVAVLAQQALIDEYQIVLVPLVLGKGRTMFEVIEVILRLRLKSSRAFCNGNVVLYYEPKI